MDLDVLWVYGWMCVCLCVCACSHSVLLAVLLGLFTPGISNRKKLPSATEITSKSARTTHKKQVPLCHTVSSYVKLDFYGCILRHRFSTLLSWRPQTLFSIVIKVHVKAIQRIVNILLKHITKTVNYVVLHCGVRLS